MQIRKLAHVAAALAVITMPALPGSLWFGAGAARAESTGADSDDWNCNHGDPDDPITQYACTRLRGRYMDPDAIAAERGEGLARNSDDLNCHRGRLHAQRTLEACARLLGHPTSVEE